MTAPALTPADASALVDRGEATLVDLRSPAEFARSHPAGAISVPFSQAGLGRRVAAVVPRGRRLVLVATDDALAHAAADALSDEGFAIAGVLAGSVSAWRAAGLPVRALGEIDVAELAAAREITVVDVREPIEHATGHVPGALLIRLAELPRELSRVPPTRRVAVICEAGVRSCTGASLLLAAGFEDVAHVPGGTAGYRRSGLPLEFPDDVGSPDDAA